MPKYYVLLIILDQNGENFVQIYAEFIDLNMLKAKCKNLRSYVMTQMQFRKIVDEIT
jgi:hypothetical protein